VLFRFVTVRFDFSCCSEGILRLLNRQAVRPVLPLRLLPKEFAGVSAPSLRAVEIGYFAILLKADFDLLPQK
jgi:hypothetical protein